MKYEINIKDIEKVYINSKNKIEHNAERYKPWMLPANTKYKESDMGDIRNFYEATGVFSRYLTNKKKLNEFSIDEYTKNIISKINMDEKNKSIFIELVKELFFYEENIINFHPKTLNYIESKKFNDKLGQFLFDVLYEEDSELLVLIHKAYEEDSDNILVNIMINNLPKIDKDKENKYKYKNFNPYISKIFIEDFKYLLKNNEMLIENIEKFLKFYYMFYVSQMAMILNKTFEADIEKPMEIYFTLDWEKTGKGRLNTIRGWDIVQSNVLRLFSHANTLHLLNHNNEDKKYSYLELKYRIDNMNEEEQLQFINDIKDLIVFYTNHIDVDDEWNDFRYTSKFNNECYDVVYKLFKTINYQFDNSGREGKQKGYGSWFIKFCKINFLKQRGRYGDIFNLTEDYTILLTKLCIKNNEKIKLKDLFFEFKRRGICLDNDSKAKLIQFYEKLNILEKKSDSGDAQYVKRIL